MSGKQPGQHAGARRPLEVSASSTSDADILARARDLAARLRSELRELIEELPPGLRGGSALSRHLSIDRATCQRAIAASRAEGLEVIENLPGLQGLEAVVKALAARSADPARADGATAALEQFDRLIQDAGGSRASLLRAIESASRVGHPDEDVEARERLYAASRDLCGRWSDVTGAIFMYRPVPGDPDAMESVSVSTLIGHHARAEAIPLTLAVASNTRADRSALEFHNLDATPAVGRSAGALLEAFSTSPPPIVTTRTPDKELIYTIDADSIDPSTGVDIVTARRPASPAPHPATESPPIHEVWMLLNTPARHMLFDVYLHRSLARQCIASMSAHLWRADIDSTIGRRWRTRFPRSPSLEVLGAETPPSPVYPRQVELTRHVFGAVSWPREEFVGFRCSLEHPVWRAGYCMTFDFTPED